MNASPELISSFNYVLLFRTYTVFAGKAKEMRENSAGILKNDAGRKKRETEKSVNVRQSFSWSRCFRRKLLCKNKRRKRA
jgi:hypothetical protein